MLCGYLVFKYLFRKLSVDSVKVKKKKLKKLKFKEYIKHTLSVTAGTEAT